jgi:uncharacterized protein (DUF2147 family)
VLTRGRDPMSRPEPSPRHPEPAAIVSSPVSAGHSAHVVRYCVGSNYRGAPAPVFRAAARLTAFARRRVAWIYGGITAAGSGLFAGLGYVLNSLMSGGSGFGAEAIMIRSALCGPQLAGRSAALVFSWLAALWTPALANPAAPLAGLWLDNTGKAAIEVRGCGPELCGNIVWLRDPLDPRGKPWTDILNPDKSKRLQPICGLQIIGGLKPAPAGLWNDGWIYDPEEGKRFNVEVSLQDINTLKIFGYAGIRLLSETLHWKRLPADSPRCAK